MQVTKSDDLAIELRAHQEKNPYLRMFGTASGCLLYDPSVQDDCKLDPASVASGRTCAASRASGRKVARPERLVERYCIWWDSSCVLSVQ